MLCIRASAEQLQAARPPAVVRSAATMLAPMDGPADELRPRFARLEDEDKTKTSFVPGDPATPWLGTATNFYLFEVGNDV